MIKPKRPFVISQGGSFALRNAFFLPLFCIDLRVLSFWDFHSITERKCRVSP